MISLKKIGYHAVEITLTILVTIFFKAVLLEELGLKDYPNYVVYLFAFLLWVILVILRAKATSQPSEEKKTWEEIRAQVIKDTLKRYRDRREFKMQKQMGYSVSFRIANHLNEEVIVNLLDDRQDHQDQISAVFRHNKRLLILGNPGYGKTVCLLSIAVRFLERAKIDAEFPIPIIIDIATYAKKGGNFKLWFDNQVIQSAGESKLSMKELDALKENHAILPFFDGLDEIEPKHRKAFIEELSIYLEEERTKKIGNIKYPESIISSRVDEYEELGVNIADQITWRILPLIPEDVKRNLNYLQSNEGGKKNAATKLLGEINKTPVITKALDSPFYNQISLALCQQDRDFPDIKEDATPNIIQETILSFYINQEIERLSSEYSFMGWGSPKNWLGWLSLGISENKDSYSFELADLSPSWFSNSFQRIMYSAWRVPYVILFSFYCVILCYAPINFLETKNAFKPQDVEYEYIQIRGFGKTRMERVAKPPSSLMNSNDDDSLVDSVGTVFGVFSTISFLFGLIVLLETDSKRKNRAMHLIQNRTKVGLFLYDFKKWKIPSRRQFYDPVVSFYKEYKNDLSIAFKKLKQNSKSKLEDVIRKGQERWWKWRDNHRFAILSTLIILLVTHLIVLLYSEFYQFFREYFLSNSPSPPTRYILYILIKVIDYLDIMLAIILGSVAGYLVILFIFSRGGGTILFFLSPIIFFIIFPAFAYVFLSLFIICSLLFGLAIFLKKGFYEEWFPKIHTPWQRVTSGIRRITLVGVIYSLLAGLILISFLYENVNLSPSSIEIHPIELFGGNALFQLLQGTSFESVISETHKISHLVSLVILIMYGVILSFFNSKLYQFFSIYLTLAFSGKIPFKVTQFLNIISSNSGLIVIDGGTWHFRHMLIHNWLSSYYETKMEKRKGFIRKLFFVNLKSTKL